MSKTILSSSEITTRTYQLEQLEIRAENDGHTIHGYAAVFNRLSEPLSDWGVPFREVVAPGAFTKTLKTADVRALVNHNVDYVLARSKSGTLSLAEDDHGLAVVINPPDTTWARDLMVSMERGDVNQMSFGFRVIKDKWESVKDENTDKRMDTRTLLEVALFDVSVVTFPAYKDTSVAVRAIELDDIVSELIVRGLNGRSLASEDQQAIDRAIEILQRCKGPNPTEPEPGQTVHSEPQRDEPAFSSHSPAYYDEWLDRVTSRAR
jgi:uncharacterized protein